MTNMKYYLQNHSPINLCYCRTTRNKTLTICVMTQLLSECPDQTDVVTGAVH